MIQPHSMPDASRIHALIPAAGWSTRMGQPKLLLPWDGETIIRRLLTHLLDADIQSVSVLVRQDDELLRRHLDEYSAGLSEKRFRRLAIYVADPPPAEMRDSVSILLSHIERSVVPAPQDAWMLLPADSVALNTGTLETLIREWRRSPRGVLVPTHQERRGHPALFAWELAALVSQIPRTHGINWLLCGELTDIREFSVDDDAVLADLDTPEDYRHWRDRRH